MNNRFEAKFILGCDPFKDNILITDLVTIIVSKLHRTPDIYANMYKIVVEKDNNIVFESFPSIEENNDKPGIHGTTFNAIFNKEDLTPYFDTELVKELYDYSRNFIKAKTEELFKLKVRYNEALLENEKEKIHHARAMNLLTCNKHNRLLNDKPLGDWIPYKDYKAELDYKKKQEDDLAEWASLDEEQSKLMQESFNKLKQEMWKEVFKKESKFKTWINKLLKKWQK